MQFTGDTAGKIARTNELDLAGHRLLVEHRVRRPGWRIGPRDRGFAGLDQKRRLGLVDRRRMRQEIEHSTPDEGGEKQNERQRPEKGSDQSPDVDFNIGGR